MARGSGSKSTCLVVIVAGAKIVIGIAAFLTGDATTLAAVRALVAFDFSAVALLLLLGGRRDERALTLGVVFLLVASVFADSLPVQASVSPGSALTLPVGLVFALEVDALTPFYVWRFARDFPLAADLPVTMRRTRRVLRACLVVGLLFLGANLLLALPGAPGGGALWAAIVLLDREVGVVYWLAQIVLSSAALLTVFQRTGRADATEQRRVALLVRGLVLGTAPALLWLLLVNVVPSALRVLPFQYAAWLIYPALLSTPVACAYAVLVRHALDVRLVVRRAIQYALARYSLIALSALPAAVLVYLVYRRRAASIADVASGLDVPLLLFLTAAGALLLRRRHGLLDLLDRRFFRTQYDARSTLGALVEGCRSATTPTELAHVLRSEIDSALQPETSAVLFLDAAGHSLVAPDAAMRPLVARSALVRRIAGSAAATIAVDDDGIQGDAAGPLPQMDRLWLLDGGISVLLPLRAADRSVVGLVALGARKSDLPYSAEDRMLLAAVISAAELTLGSRGITPGAPGADSPAPIPVGECVSCGALGDWPADGACRRCGCALQPGALPLMVGDRFRLDSRLGSGGMGVVYRATDLALGRAVTLKTLPMLTPGESLRLRREARAMALVTHPNLALIFGAESWYGRPILVCEYLPGGTLAERIVDGPLGTDAVVDLGIALAEVLGAIHTAGVLHRDVKPTNIGFTEDGRPKLLDFGLARILDGARAGGAWQEPPMPDVRAWLDVDDAEARRPLTSAGSGSVLLGTPPYMAPEALAGLPPAPTFDLWGLAIVLFEATTGLHPFRTADGTLDRRRMLAGRAADARAAMPHADPGIAAVLRTALAPEPSDRYRTAAAFGAALREVRVARHLAATSP